MSLRALSPSSTLSAICQSGALQLGWTHQDHVFEGSEPENLQIRKLREANSGTKVPEPLNEHHFHHPILSFSQGVLHLGMLSVGVKVIVHTPPFHPLGGAGASSSS